MAHGPDIVLVDEPFLTRSRQFIILERLHLHFVTCILWESSSGPSVLLRELSTCSIN